MRQRNLCTVFIMQLIKIQNFYIYLMEKNNQMNDSGNYPNTIRNREINNIASMQELEKG